MSFLFETLNVYQMALEFHLKIVDLCQSDSFRGYSHLTDQFKRASLSIFSSKYALITARSITFSNSLTFPGQV